MQISHTKLVVLFEYWFTRVTDYSYKQIVHLTSSALIVAVQDSCRGSFRLVRANLKYEPIDAEF
ncbi:unnamed protein product [Tenebrio molitor]|nr:unnamed protein product [Tenebrio molitor]